MSGGGRDAGAVFLSPRGHYGAVLGHWSAEACFASVGASCGFQRGSGCVPSSAGSFGNALALHVGDLCQHGEDQFAHAAPNRPQSMHIHDHTHFNEVAHGRLDIQRVPPEPIHGIDV
ncbi:hypothetical protein D3C72_1537430 [compost metagenome]